MAITLSGDSPNLTNASLTTPTLTSASLTTPTLTSPTFAGTPSGSIITSGTAIVSTSGTSIDFTSIPSWVKRITLLFNEVSTNGTSIYNFRVGTSSGVVSTGYVSTGEGMGAGVSASSSTSGFIIGDAIAAASVFTGTATITNISGNTWIFSGMAKRGTGDSGIGNGVIALGGTLDRVRITTAGGTDTFDAGSINILFE